MSLISSHTSLATWKPWAKLQPLTGFYLSKYYLNHEGLRNPGEITRGPAGSKKPGLNKAKTLAVFIQPTHKICKQLSVSGFPSSFDRNWWLTEPDLDHRPLFADHCSKKCKLTTVVVITQITGALAGFAQWSGCWPAN